VTLITLIDGAARQWKFTISPASVLPPEPVMQDGSAAKPPAGLDDFGRGRARHRRRAQFRFQRLDVGVDFDVSRIRRDVPLQLWAMSWAAVSAISPSTSSRC